MLPTSHLQVLLKGFRCRIDPRVTTLGRYKRTSKRYGKPVSQYEIARSIGVSRTWYGLLESERPVRTSIVLLDRLATVLMLTHEERTLLFAAAFPELQFAAITHDTRT
jgi:transcriptional regulator with XRE-family HTH domain